MGSTGGEAPGCGHRGDRGQAVTTRPGAVFLVGSAAPGRPPPASSLAPGSARRRPSAVDPAPYQPPTGPSASGALSAAAHDGEVAAVEVEAELLLEHPEQRPQLGDRQLLDPFALLAEQVLVGLVGQVVDGPAVAEVHVVDHPQLLQRVQRAVHRREVDRGEAGLDGGGDLLRRHVAAGADHRFDDGLPAGRAAPTGGGEAGEDLLDDVAHTPPPYRLSQFLAFANTRRNSLPGPWLGPPMLSWRPRQTRSTNHG